MFPEDLNNGDEFYILTNNKTNISHIVKFYIENTPGDRYIGLCETCCGFETRDRDNDINGFTLQTCSRDVASTITCKNCRRSKFFINNIKTNTFFMIIYSAGKARLQKIADKANVPVRFGYDYVAHDKRRYCAVYSTYENTDFLWRSYNNHS